MNRKLLMVTIFLIAGMCIFPVCQADDNNREEEFNLTKAEQEVTLPQPPEKIAIPDLPSGRSGINASGELISGIGNLSRLVEINTTQGDYAFGLFQIEGDDSTRWDYLIESSNGSSCYVIGYVSVSNATKVLFQGHALSPDQHLSYAGIGLQNEVWPDAGRYSGDITIATLSHQNATSSWISAQNETGTITHLCRSYQVIDGNDSTPFDPQNIPGLEWNPQMEKTDDQPQAFFYHQYAGSYCEINHGLMDSHTSYSASSRQGAQTVQILKKGHGKGISLNTWGEEWPPGDVHSSANSTFEEWRADNVIAVDHYGMARYSSGAGIAFGETKGTAESFDYRINPEADKRKSEMISGYAGGSVVGNAVRKQTGRVSIPASFEGYLVGTQVNNQCQVQEKYSLSGTQINREIQGYFETMGKPDKSGIFGNISAGNKNEAMGATRLNGVSSLLVNFPQTGEISVDGRWIADAREGLPIIRNIVSTMPGKTAYSSSQTISGLKYIKEEGVYRNGYVDVI